MLKTGLIADPVFCQHDTGAGHPECAQRFHAVVGALEDAGLLEQLTKLEGRKATRAEISLCHASDYLSLVEHEIVTGATELFTGDTSVCEESWDVALLAAGSVLSAVDAVMEGKIDNAFCAVRPPGHHATANRGMGFCVLNNVAIAARYAQQKHQVKRVLIVDWDVHHGNGTQDIFYQDGSVFFFSTHMVPSYPGTGASSETGLGEGEGTTMNFAFPVGSGREEIFQAFECNLVEAMKKFRPNLVLVSAGFDSRIHDPLGGFCLRDEDFHDLTKLLLDLAEKYAQGRLVSVLEGGYNLSGLGSATVAHVQALCAGGSGRLPAVAVARKSTSKGKDPNAEAPRILPGGSGKTKSGPKGMHSKARAVRPR